MELFFGFLGFGFMAVVVAVPVYLIVLHGRMKELSRKVERIEHFLQNSEFKPRTRQSAAVNRAIEPGIASVTSELPKIKLPEEPAPQTESINETLHESRFTSHDEETFNASDIKPTVEGDSSLQAPQNDSINETLNVPDEETHHASRVTPNILEESWEEKLGGKVFNRIGAIALVFAAGFFLKYAFDNDWISDTVKLLIGAAAGFSLLFASFRFHKRGYSVFSQGLTGAGISILYLTVWASFSLYDLTSQLTAFILMSCVTVLSFRLSVYYNSLAAAILSLLGGILTPVLLSTGQPNHYGLFSYLLLLNWGVLALTFKKKQWQLLPLIAVIGSNLYIFGWLLHYFNYENFPEALAFFSLFWLSFKLPYFAARLRNIEINEGLSLAINTLNTIFYFISMMYIFGESHDAWNSFVALVIAIIYLSETVFLLKNTSCGLIDRNNAMLGVLIFVFAAVIEFEEEKLLSILFIQSLIIMFIAKSLSMQIINKTGYILAGISAFVLGLFLTTQPEFSGAAVFFNIRGVAVFLMFITAFISVRFFSPGKYEEAYRSTAVIFSLLFAAAWIVTEIHHYKWYLVLGKAEIYTDLYEYNSRIITGAMLLVYIAGISVFGILKKNIDVLRPAALIALFTAVYISIISVPADYMLVLNSKSVLMLGLIAISFTSAYFGRHKAVEEIPVFFISLALILIFVYITSEPYQYLGMVTEKGVSEYPENFRQMIMSLMWLLYAISLMASGIILRNKYLRISAICVLGIVVLKVFLFDLSFLETLYRIFSFFGLGIILITASYLYQKYRDRIL